MLRKLQIQNYAIIKQVEIDFTSNLNIITGETGAGKSIIMGALGLILGERADAKAIMNENEKCIIEGIFDLNDDSLKLFFDEHELDFDNTCILRREIAPGGKSRAFVNDTPVQLNLLKELGINLIDIVSQHQTLSLNQAEYQLMMVDSMANNQQLLIQYQQLFQTYKSSQKKLETAIENQAKGIADFDYFTFLLQELSEANIDVNEQTIIESKIETLTHAEQIQQIAAKANQVFEEEESGLIDLLNHLKADLITGAKFHSGLKEALTRLNSLLIESKDLSKELSQIAGNTLVDNDNLNTLNQRLQLLLMLQKKHRVNSNEELIVIKNQLQEKISNINSADEDIAKLIEECDRMKKDLFILAETLHSNRQNAITNIIKKINQLLNEVEMPDAKVEFTCEKNITLGQTGITNLSLLFCANKGGVFLPINKVASGGELSRLMLCVKSLISEKVNLATIVFDEIDTGISGEAAKKVGQVMQQHALKHQVIAITHLPQIAAKAHHHLFAYKQTQGNQTHTFLKSLNSSERIDEIARMLHGANPSAKVIEAAKELISF